MQCSAACPRFALIPKGRPTVHHLPECMPCAGLLAILRMAVETRRTALVDLSLDLIQKLIAHGHLAGSVYNISHKRDPAAGRSDRKVCSRPLLVCRISQDKPQRTSILLH